MAMERLDGVRDRMREVRTEKLERDNERLRGEVDHLRSRLDVGRDERDDLLDTMKAIGKRRPKRRMGLLRVAILSGGAYLLGARAGRERYEQVVAKARELWSKIRDEQDGTTSTRSISAAVGGGSPAGDVRTS